MCDVPGIAVFFHQIDDSLVNEVKRRHPLANERWHDLIDSDPSIERFLCQRIYLTMRRWTDLFFDNYSSLLRFSAFFITVCFSII